MTRILPISRTNGAESPEGGYTLLEVLVVTAIIGLMATLVTTHLPGRTGRHDLELQVYRLETSLRIARSESLSSGQPIPFVVDVSKGAWSYSGHAKEILPPGISVALYTGRNLLQNSGAGEILFFPSGRSSGGHVEISAGNQSERIDIDWLTGRIHLHADE